MTYISVNGISQFTSGELDVYNLNHTFVKNSIEKSNLFTLP